MIDIDKVIATVTEIIEDLNAGMDYECLASKYGVFKTENPKVYSLATSDPDCLRKLGHIKALREKSAQGMSHHDMSVVFGQVLADQYLQGKH